MEPIITTQQELYGRIARTFENLKKAGSAKITSALVSTTVKLLDSKWEKVEENHEQLRSKYWEALRKHEYYIQDFLGQIEKVYAHQRAAILELGETLTAAKGEKKTTASDASAPPRTTLPRIQLPHFSGKYEDWPSFRDLFKSLITKDSSISDVTRLHYLKASLKGEAEMLIRNLPTTDENFGRAWQTLKEFYKNTRLLVRSFYSTFAALPKLKTESATELRKLFHCVTSTAGALESIGRPITSSEDMYVFMIVELLDPRSRREWENHTGGTTEPASFAELRQFLERRLHTLEAMQLTKPEGPPGKANDRTAKTARTHHVQKEKERCTLCKRDHFLMMCGAFKKKSGAERKQFVDNSQLCRNCLGKHKVSECQSKRSCTVCGERHHSTLHDAWRASASAPSPTVIEPAKTSHVAHRPSEGRPVVLLATARINVADRSGESQTARALIDQGSETSIITEAFAQRLRLPRKRASVAVYGVGGQQTAIARGQVTLRISSRREQPVMTVSAIVLPRLTVYAGVTSVAMREWSHLRNLDLADPEFLASDDIDVLLGADIYAAILDAGVRKGGAREPVAQQTTLGWIVSGTVGALSPQETTHLHQCTLGEPLSALVRRFWEQEEVQQPTTPLTSKEQECEDSYARTHSRNHDGRYMVRLPIAAALPSLGATHKAAARVLTHMEGRFARDDHLKHMYTEFMMQYEALQHMSRVEPAREDQRRLCYLPHHGVMKESSTSTKLRVVFNGSWTTAGDDSLNKHLLVGPNLLPPLADVLLRWRWHRYVFVADIEKMYRQILVHPADRDLQRIMWRSSQEQPIGEYQLNTVTYGLACAPFLAIRTLRQLADDEGPRFPKGASTLRQDVYVDDILTGASTLREARDIQHQLMEICTAGGFPLKKWAANDAHLLAEIPDDDLAQPDPRAWQQHQGHSALGLQWHPKTDCFSFVHRAVQPRPVTKRSILSQAAQLFDPLGWLAPVVVRAKICIQSTWLQGLDWDTPLPDADARQWETFLEELPRLEDIQVPRWLSCTSGDEPMEVHGFADASERAYGAAVYLRKKEADEWWTTLVVAKTKVAPLKQVSVPRLELCAAVLLTRLVVHVQQVLELSTKPTHLWSDSTVTLGWIQGHPSRWHTFVANRVSEIQTTLPDAQWHHVATQDNPADCASRGMPPGELARHTLWWQGPTWLNVSHEPWTSASLQEIGDLPEQRTKVHAAGTNPQPEESDLLRRYSSLQKLLRITAWCRRWRHARLNNQGRAGEPRLVSAEEIDHALFTWVRVVQAATYKEELEAVSTGKPLSKKSLLTKLSPFTDEQGILRVGGRIKHSLLAYDEKHPIILPKNSVLTTLVVDSCHSRTLHGGVQQTLGLLRQRFWVPGGRTAVKAHIHRCLRCLRWRAAIPQQLMGDLPEARVTPSRPFQHTGVDYAGPVMMQTSGGRGHKAYKGYIAVFVCLSTRAVHLEAASDYTADAFLAALRRFISRRGLCQVLYSDCGTNFTGADAALRDLFAASSKEARHIGRALAEERIQWRFNPPAAPHFGGLWEAAVKSLKHHLRRVIGDSTLTFEELTTFLTQVEACLNSRPFQPMSDDPEDTSALTPGHFLVGSALLAAPEPTLTEVPAGRLARWQHLQQLRAHFWDRWSREYIHSLAARPKWWKGNASPRVGQLCLLRSETTPPTKWPLSRITAVHSGQDGHVRVVTVRTATSEFTRPLVKIVLFPDDSCK